MPRFNRRITLGFVLCGIAGRALGAQQPALPPIRPLGGIIAASVDPLGDVQSVRMLTDGGAGIAKARVN